MFKELHEKLKDGEALNVFIKRNEDGTITTSISFRVKDKSYAPVTATGTPEEMDNEFINVIAAITEKIAVAGLKISTEALDTELKEEPKTNAAKTEKKVVEPSAKQVEQNLILAIISNAEKAIEENKMDVLTESFNEIESAIKADKKRGKNLEIVRQNIMKAQAIIRMNEEEDVNPIEDENETQVKTSSTEDDVDPMGIEDAEIIEETPFGGKKEEEEEDVTNLFN